MCFGKTLNWLKLPNSGDSLKLMIPSYFRKIISGQNNYLGTVTSHKMSENEMDYRGSKSEYLMGSVKEQRVDGSWSIKTKFSKMLLRYTLMGFERNYLVKIPSKQLNIKKFSSLPCTTRPWFWTGLIDAEGSFSILVCKSHTHKSGRHGQK